MRWALVQRWSAIALLALVLANAHIAWPSVAVAKGMSLALLLAAATHVAASLYVVLTDYRPFAGRSRAVAVTTIVLAAGAAVYGGAVIARADGPKPVLGHLPGAECRACHDQDEHRRWPLALHAAKDGKPGVDCEGCHGIAALSTKLLAFRDAESGRHVPAPTTIELCLDCHNPRMSEEPMWPGAIHGTVKCGTCHSHNTTPEDPSWKRSCTKCHPREDDLHGRVWTLDTTYLSPDSRYDVHTMTCASCHRDALGGQGGAP